MESYYKSVVDVGKKLLGLVALALDLEENFFERLGAFNDQAAVVRLLRYSGELNSSKEEEPCGASAHSDFGMLTLLATDGVPGLQVCRDKDKEPNVWEDCFVVNIGDLMERWTNGLFRSTMHRVLSVGEERYSVAVFLDPDPNCVVECLESCCSQTYPPRFPPVRTSDYFHERFSQSLILGMYIRGPNRVSVFRVYKNQSHSGYMKIRFGTGSDSIGFGSGLVNLQRTGTTRCTFWSGSQSVLRFK
ncbi:BnaC01g21570D, partial [Brassica napus]